MDQDASKKDRIDDTVRGRPVPILGNDDHGQEHEREAVVDGAQPADETDGVAVANKEAE